MTTVFAQKAMLAGGWADRVRISVAAGRIADIATGVAAEAGDERADIVIPGICNAHSHAFQRALAGRTEQRSPAGEDNFWSWRSRMYELANRIKDAQLVAIATQAYSEMLVAGYTSVAEFHYLHGNPDSDQDAMFWALQTAASNAGIRLTYVPVLYERASFEHSEPHAQQRRFVMSLDAFLEHHDRCTRSANEFTTVAIGAHSLRAVSAASLRAVAQRAHERNIPMHLHIAEQQAEVEQCISATGLRPVEWLLENLGVDAAWCLVHATHINAAEIRALAATSAVVCLCPTTEANLGDGLFPLRDYLRHGGRLAIGSDSQASIDPMEELRWLEYGQRLQLRARNIAALDDLHVGQALFDRVVAGGAQAGGLGSAGLTVGAGADLITLAGDDAMLLGHDDETLLDALVFSGYRSPIDRVMAMGEWQVLQGRHARADTTRENFAAAMSALR